MVERCLICNRQFGDENALQQHAKRKHKQPRATRARDEEEESLAGIAVEATWKRAAGLPLDPLEESLVP